jgi:hypothetical protein
MDERGFALKHFLLLFIIGFSVIGIIVAVFAIRNPANLETEALGCAQKPKMVLESTNKYENMTIYNLKLINNCSSENEFLVKITKFPETPMKYDNWSWKFKNGDWNTPLTTEKLSGTTDMTLTIQNPKYGSGLPEKIQQGIYRFFVVETALANSPASADKLELIYTAN